jgi:DNA processing protein
MNRPELSTWLRLLLTPGVGQVSAHQLLRAFGSPESLFERSRSDWTTVVSPSQANALSVEPDDLAALLDTTWNWLCESPETRQVLTIADPLYPKSLLNTEDPPLLLYASGMPEVWQDDLLNVSDARCLAIVGSRNPTPQGASNARQFACALAEAGVTVVSGMALGIDGAAHEGAMEGAAPGRLATIAVVGTGLDRVYPKQHRDLAHSITRQGVILSEFALGTGPHAAHFPQRNRIISGLSRGVLVVEAALQSGSLITARLAADQGREVYAIPGSIHSTQSRGCHALIKQGAKLVESAADILEELEWESVGTSLNESDDPPDSPLLQALGFDAVGLDALQARTGIPTPDLLAQLMTLELSGSVARLPGGLFQRVAQA